MTLARFYSAFRSWAAISAKRPAAAAPAQVTLSVTNRCNVVCEHCYYYSPLISYPNSFDRRLARETEMPLPKVDRKSFARVRVDRAQLTTALDEILDLGTRRILFSGNGEPLTHPDLVSLMEKAAARGAWVGVNTNGTCLTPAIIDRLAGAGRGELRVTTMAGNRDLWCRTHPDSDPCLFDRMDTALRHARDASHGRHAGTSPSISLVFVITATNVHGIGDFADYAVELGVNQAVYRVVDDVGDTGLTVLRPSPEQTGDAIEQLTRAKARLEAAGIRHNIGNVRQVFSSGLDTRAFHRIVPCYYVWLSARIEVNGNVYPCCRGYHSFGNAFEQGFRNTWHAPAYQAFRREALRLHRRDKPLPSCKCWSCVHHNANLRAYRVLHPINGRRRKLLNLRPGTANEDL